LLAVVRQDAVMDVDALARVQEDSYARTGPGLASSWPRESAMNAAQLGVFLEERRYCVLATTNAAGHPVARPVSFAVLGSSFWFATVAGARLRNLERTPWTSVVFEAGDVHDHRAVAVDGPVTIASEASPELREVWEQRHGSRAEWAAAWFELRPQRLVSYSARHDSS
jgi:nitroimidazol reductase NimA-like FMN-containing flavoprotein (pyridoxamine 5'-phosphate oxidase superfamily)